MRMRTQITTHNIHIFVNLVIVMIMASNAISPAAAKSRVSNSPDNSNAVSGAGNRQVSVFITRIQARLELLKQMAVRQPKPVVNQDILPPGTVLPEKSNPVYLPLIQREDPDHLSRSSITAWEQLITPLGSGFESTWVGGWVLIHTQHPVRCSTDGTNAIYTRTRTVGYTDDKDWARWLPRSRYPITRPVKVSR